MSEAMANFSDLDRLVRPINAKLTLKKDSSKPYVGLEHLPSRGAYLLGWEAASHSVSTNSVFSDGDVLFGKLRPNLRKCVSAPFDGYCSTDILVLRARKDIHARFAARVFQSETVSAAAERTAIGTKMPRTSWTQLSGLKVFCPEFSEQELISHIFDTLDIAIQQTEASIAKLKALKQGLLHDLLTRGVNVNGELRPPQTEAPHLYQFSPLGWIPCDWTHFFLKDLAESIVDGPFGSNLKTEHYVANPGVRVVRLQNIQVGEYDDEDRAFISDKHATSLVRNRVTSGDALIASLGDDNYPVGRSCLYPTYLPDAVNKADCFRFRGKAGCSNAYVALFMNTLAARRQIRGYEQGVTMKRINLGNLKRLCVSLPRTGEQGLIVERIAAATAQIDAHVLQLRKLQGQKLGLSNDLLTGLVRVSCLLTQAKQAALLAVT